LFVFFESKIINTGHARLVVFVRFYPRVVNGEFFKVSQDWKGQFRGVYVPPYLVGMFGSFFDINRRFFRFDKKLSYPAYSETVIGSFLGAVYFNLVFANNVTVAL
jgi:hypothetical protein